ncbi:MAG: DNA repair protein RecO [Hyphomicrobiaceae bacterium]|nr:DNA repair protein RecO [Hyphomicrobiaceae bacterium]
MQWSDEAIVLGARAHGETAAVAEIFTRSHGRHLGLVHGGRGRRARPVLQAGNHIDATWTARLPEQLGHIAIELRAPYAARSMADGASLAGLQSLTALLRLLPERDPHPALFEVSLFVLGFLDDPSVWPALMVRWEVALLEDLGFGLDLGQCAATGGNDDLVYVSPKSGRAVSASAGAPYADRLLRLPGFLVKGREAVLMPGDVAAGFALTGYFLETRVLAPRGLAMPEARGRLVDLVG